MTATVAQCLTELLAQSWLTDGERALLQHLAMADQRGCYWDVLSRLQVLSPDTALIAENITIKARANGVLRDKKLVLQSDIPEHGAVASTDLALRAGADSYHRGE